MLRLEHCKGELLYYTSRYYSYTEKFLSETAGLPDFCMAGYNPRRLTHSQRDEMSNLISKKLTKRSTRQICKLIETVIK